jgi:hypothetical protein
MHHRCRSGLKTRDRRELRPPREASRRALEAIREQKKEERRMKRILRDIEPDVAVGELTVCTKPIHELKLKPYQRKLKHLCGTSHEKHATYTRCPKMWGPMSLRCHNKHCERRGCGVLHGAHVCWRVDRRSKRRQCGIIATCVPCNTTSGSFKASRGSSVFVLARVMSRYPSKPYDPREDTVIDNAIFES